MDTQSKQTVNTMSMEPVIIIVAPTGSYKNKEHHAALPLTIEEITATAKSCFAAGSTMFHLHIRDNNHRHLLDAAVYKAAIKSIRNAVGHEMIIQTTTESAKIYQPEQQMAVIKSVKPESVSVALREIIPDSSTEETAQQFFSWLQQEGIIVQYILYSPEDVRRYSHYKKIGIIPANHKSLLLLVMGKYQPPIAAEPRDLLAYLHEVPTETRWAVAAFGPHEHLCTQAAAALGGHVRIGFENNLYLKDGQLAADNAALIKQAVDTIKSLGRPLASAQKAREILSQTL